MSYDHAISTDQLGDEREAEDRAATYAEDDAREQRWAVFVTLVKAQHADGRCWGDILHDLSWARIAVDNSWRSGWLTSRERVYIDFAETEGWSAVLQAIARAMKDTESAQ